MNRKPVFDAARAEGVDFSKPGNIQILDNALSFLGFPNDGAPVAPKPSRKCAALIKEFEGCGKLLPDGRLAAYPDPGTGGDPWTIGWGSTGPDIRRGTVWTQEQADARFAEQLEEFGQGVAKLLGAAPTSQNQFDALVSFAYNVGLGALKESTLLRRHKEGAYAGAALEFARWNKAGGRVLPGLVRRRHAEAELYRSGS